MTLPQKPHEREAMRQKQGEAPQHAVDHQRVVRASARILAYHRWNNDAQGRDVYRQLVLWTDDTEDQETPARLTVA
jgi:hypothetical protein